METTNKSWSNCSNSSGSIKTSSPLIGKIIISLQKRVPSTSYLLRQSFRLGIRKMTALLRTSTSIGLVDRTARTITAARIVNLKIDKDFEKGGKPALDRLIGLNNVWMPNVPTSKMTMMFWPLLCLRTSGRLRILLSFHLSSVSSTNCTNVCI
jgi:hypothetical protein